MAADLPLFSTRHRFSDWPNESIPAVSAGVYIIWHSSLLMYCGMSGREIEQASARGKSRYGLVTRLQSHARGRLSGDQFCVYVANRLVIPGLQPDQLESFATGETTLDELVKRYVHEHFEYQFACVSTSAEAYEIERIIRDGSALGQKPLLNPLHS